MSTILISRMVPMGMAPYLFLGGMQSMHSVRHRMSCADIFRRNEQEVIAHLQELRKSIELDV